MTKKNLRCERCGKPTSTRTQDANTGEWIGECCDLPNLVIAKQRFTLATLTRWTAEFAVQGGGRDERKWLNGTCQNAAELGG